LILPPKKKKLFLFARLTSDYIFVYLSPGTICFKNVLISTSCFNRHGNVFFSRAYFLNQLNAKPSLQNQLS